MRVWERKIRMHFRSHWKSISLKSCHKSGANMETGFIVKSVSQPTVSRTRNTDTEWIKLKFLIRTWKWMPIRSAKLKFYECETNSKRRTRPESVRDDPLLCKFDRAEEDRNRYCAAYTQDQHFCVVYDWFGESTLTDRTRILAINFRSGGVWLTNPSPLEWFSPGATWLRLY